MVWAGLAGEQSRSTGPPRFDRGKDDSDGEEAVEKNKMRGVLVFLFCFFSFALDYERAFRPKQG